MAVVERIYARALFEAAQEQDAIEVIKRDLDAFAEAVVASPELAQYLANPQVKSAAKEGVLGELSEDADELVRNFLRLTAAKGRSAQIPAMRDAFQALVDQAQGRVVVELTTAFELSEDDASAIVKQIEEASGQTVEASRKVDPELVGGMILQAGSLRVDASVRGRLERLRHELVTR